MIGDVGKPEIKQHRKKRGFPGTELSRDLVDEDTRGNAQKPKNQPRRVDLMYLVVGHQREPPEQVDVECLQLQRQGCIAVLVHKRQEIELVPVDIGDEGAVQAESEEDRQNRDK